MLGCKSHPLFYLHGIAIIQPTVAKPPRYRGPGYCGVLYHGTYIVALCMIQQLQCSSRMCMSTVVHSMNSVGLFSHVCTSTRVAGQSETSPDQCVLCKTKPQKNPHRTKTRAALNAADRLAPRGVS